MLAASLRVITMLGYRGAWLYYGDSFAYLDIAEHPRPLWGFQPSGYPLFLWLLRPFHSLAIVVSVQHLLGLVTGTLIYTLLRRRSLPAWGAVLATVPVLFDASFLALEHSVLSDTLFIFLIVAAVTALMWSPQLSTNQAATAGLLLASAALTRTIVLPLLVMVVAYVTIRRAGWRKVGVLAVAGGLPLIMYASWYAQQNGRFTLAGGDGIALWARTMTFANCKTIKPPPEETPFCPNGSRKDAASEYVWDSDSPINQMPGGFGNNDRARSFALRAMAAQPLDYLADVVGDTSLAFHWTPAAHPKRVTPAFGFTKGRWPLADKPLVRRSVRGYDPSVRDIHSVEPYAGFLRTYQHPAYLRGPMLAVLFLLGVLGIRRRTLLSFGAAAFLLIAPVAVLDFDHRYVLPAVPLVCLAAALSLADLRNLRRPSRQPNEESMNPRLDISDAVAGSGASDHLVPLG